MEDIIIPLSILLAILVIVGIPVLLFINSKNPEPKFKVDPEKAEEIEKTFKETKVVEFKKR